MKTFFKYYIILFFCINLYWSQAANTTSKSNRLFHYIEKINFTPIIETVEKYKLLIFGSLATAVGIGGITYYLYKKYDKNNKNKPGKKNEKTEKIIKYWKESCNKIFLETNIQNAQKLEKSIRQKNHLSTASVKEKTASNNRKLFKEHYLKALTDTEKNKEYQISIDENLKKHFLKDEKILSKAINHSLESMKNNEYYIELFNKAFNNRIERAKIILEESLQVNVSNSIEKSASISIEKSASNSSELTKENDFKDNINILINDIKEYIIKNNSFISKYKENINFNEYLEYKSLNNEMQTLLDTIIAKNNRTKYSTYINIYSYILYVFLTNFTAEYDNIIQQYYQLLLKNKKSDQNDINKDILNITENEQIIRGLIIDGQLNLNDIAGNRATLLLKINSLLTTNQTTIHNIFEKQKIKASPIINAFLKNKLLSTKANLNQTLNKKKDSFFKNRNNTKKDETEIYLKNILNNNGKFQEYQNYVNNKKTIIALN